MAHPMVGASFVKCLADPAFTSELQVPKEFLKKYAETLQPTIELRLENEPRISRNVNTELAGKRCFLTAGWGSFAKAAGLKHLETVVFTFTGGSVFDVSVYDVTGCKKLPSDAAPENIPAAVEIGDNDVEIIDSTTPENWKFTKKVKDSHYSDMRMDIPKKFALTTGITKGMRILLSDGEGRKWPVTITDRGRKMFNMSAGFVTFMKANGVKVGSIISFEFIRASDNTVEARITPPPPLHQ